MEIKWLTSWNSKRKIIQSGFLHRVWMDIAKLSYSLVRTSGAGKKTVQVTTNFMSKWLWNQPIMIFFFHGWKLHSWPSYITSCKHDCNLIISWLWFTQSPILSQAKILPCVIKPKNLDKIYQGRKSTTRFDLFYYLEKLS